jgi:hypothetical protein
MRIVLNKILIVGSFFFSALAWAKEDLPEPQHPSATPPPPPLPIDENLIFLIFVGVFLGIYMIRRNKKAKASV